MLSLSFPPCNAHSPSTDQWAILSTILGQHPLPRLTFLSIRNLTPFHDPIFDLPAFRDLFVLLDYLSISLHHGRSPQRRFRDSFVEFWQHAVQHQVLNTLASHPQSLTEFSLHSDIDVGIVAKIDFSDLHFPALTFISLTGILFNEETHVEDFIVRHKRTLRTLSLQSCNIAIHDPIQGPPRFWSQIYTRFADVLEELMWRPILTGRYAQLDPETGYSYLVQGRVRDEDAEALKLLVARVTSRSG